VVGVPLTLLLAGEGSLRLAGYGYPTGFFLPRRINGNAVWVDNRQFGERFFPPGLVRHPKPLTMPVNKAPDTVRVFVLGESAAMGDPDPKFGLPRMLEVLLRECFPTRHIEVVNVSMVAINSHVILPIARECARRQGDLWVVYMGNNEMIGPFGSITVFGPQAPSLAFIRANLALHTTRLGQLSDRALTALRRGNQRPAAWGGMEMLAKQQIRQDDPRTARVYEHFRRNLDDILTAARRAGVPIVLCTVATNLRDCAPFASLHRADLTASELAEWEAAYGQGVALESRGNLAEALTWFERAANVDDHFADLCFRRGQCCQALGQSAEAKRHFLRAREQDALQFRADTRINEMVRQCAATYATRGVHLLDAEELLAAHSPAGLPGEEFFYEHVHPNPAGNYLLARAVAGQVAEILSLGQVKPEDDPPPPGDGTEARVAELASQTGTRQGRLPSWVSEAECLQMLGFTEWHRHDFLAKMLARVDAPPFTQQINHARHRQSLQEQFDRSRLATKPFQVKRAAEQVAQAVARHPKDADLRWNLAELLGNAGNVAGAEAQWREVIRLQPQAVLSYYNLAKLIENRGRDGEVEKLYRECLRIDPGYFEARYAFGLVLTRQGQPAEAVRHLLKAVRQQPRSTEAHLALGLALVQDRKLAEAKGQFLEVLRLDPGNAQARNLLETSQRRP